MLFLYLQVYEIYAENGKGWQRALVELKLPKGKFRIYFESSIGSPTATSSVDDVLVLKKPCIEGKMCLFI